MSKKRKKKKSYSGWITLTGLLTMGSFGWMAYEVYSKSDKQRLYISFIVAVMFSIIMIALMVADAKQKAGMKTVKGERLFEKAPRPEIVKTKLMAVNGVNQTQRSGTVSGAIVGGLIGGGLGALVGAAANTKDRQYNVDNKYAFLVIYDNGDQKLETVSEKYEKKRFDLLVSKLVVEE